MNSRPVSRNSFRGCRLNHSATSSSSTFLPPSAMCYSYPSPSFSSRCLLVSPLVARSLGARCWCLLVVVRECVGCAVVLWLTRCGVSVDEHILTASSTSVEHFSLLRIVLLCESLFCSCIITSVTSSPRHTQTHTHHHVAQWLPSFEAPRAVAYDCSSLLPFRRGCSSELESTRSTSSTLDLGSAKLSCHHRGTE